MPRNTGLNRILDPSVSDHIVAIPNSTYIFNRIKDKLRWLHTAKNLHDDDYICSLGLDKRLHNTGYTTAILDTVFSKKSSCCNSSNSHVIVSNKSRADLLLGPAYHLCDQPYNSDFEDSIISLGILKNNPSLIVQGVTYLFLDNNIKFLDKEAMGVLYLSGCDTISMSDLL